MGTYTRKYGVVARALLGVTGSGFYFQLCLLLYLALEYQEPSFPSVYPQYLTVPSILWAFDEYLFSERCDLRHLMSFNRSFQILKNKDIIIYACLLQWGVVRTK